MAVRISVIIPTQRRPDGLERAVRSVFRQRGVDHAAVELLVADNDIEPSARALAESLALDAPFGLRYVHEPNPGVANVRNAAVAVVQGEMIAFLDDDEEAQEAWLNALLHVQARFHADVVFGPVRGRAPADVIHHRAYLESFFSRTGPSEARPIDDYYGCGNSLVRRAALPDPDRPFAAARNRTGGEDDLLFGQMQRDGARFAWAPDAWVWEDPVPERLTLGYATLRAFAYGQGPTNHCAARRPVDVLGVIRWMAIGLGQALVFGAAAAATWLVRAPARAYWLDRAARGLGKTLWFGPFNVHFYGRRV